MTARAAGILLGALLFAAGVAPAASDEGETEVLRYHWELKGLLGTVARIFLPGSGEGAIINRPEGSDRIRSEFKITSVGASKQAFWTYGSLIDMGRLRPIEAWNEAHYKDKDKRREAEINEPGMIDIPTGIHLLRRDPPEKPLRLMLWADGRVYPVLFERHGLTWRRVDGKKLLVQASSVVGLNEPGQRRWEGRLDLWATPDERAIPVEILFRRDGAKVLLTLVDPVPAG